MKLQIFFIVTIAVLCASANFVCKVGVPYNQNQCNSCVCDTSGVLSCTDKACAGGSASLERCKVGDVSLSGCNTCWCVQGYGTVCTANKC